VEYFTTRFSNRAGKRIGTISKAALDALQAYDWPGNIRELQSLTERAARGRARRDPGRPSRSPEAPSRTFREAS